MAVLKEINKSVNCQCSNYIALLPPTAGSILSNGCQIHIKIDLTESDRKIIKNILKNKELALSESEGKLIIYKPTEFP
jgi:predicted RNA-binding protein Jag